MSEDKMLATILNELRESRKELAELRREVSELQREKDLSEEDLLDEDLPSEGDQSEAAKVLGFKSTRAVRNMHDLKLIKGLHYWHVGKSPRYDLPLLRHGQRHGFGSVAHLKVVNERRKQIERTAKSRTSFQRVK